ncbi:MAG: response regulator, partial [Cyclobacteriaceae bacterium]
MIYKILIIEDEAPARKKLKAFIDQICPSYEIVDEIESVEQAIGFLSGKEKIDLIFSDIELRDGNAFEIFNTISIHCPIIFTTAYNQFLIHAFETNGIGYLLKPYSFEKFAKAWSKFLRLTSTEVEHLNVLFSKMSDLMEIKSLAKVDFKEQFVIKSGTGIY